MLVLNHEAAGFGSPNRAGLGKPAQREVERHLTTLLDRAEATLSRGIVNVDGLP